MDKSTVTMLAVADGRSTLNPYAPIFIPEAAFEDVEDFSPEWWELVKTSPRFREYWLSQQQEDDFISSDGDGCDYVEVEELFCSDGSHFVDSEASMRERGLPNGLEMDAKALLGNLNWNLDVSKSPKGRVGKAPIGPVKYCDRIRGNKRVSARCTAPRRIHQPR